MYNSKKNSTSSNPANPPTLGNSCTIDAAFYLVSTEVALEKANGLASKGALHRSHAAVAEIQPDATMPVVILFSKLIKPTVYKGRDTTLLSAYGRVLRVHCRLTSAYAIRQPSTSPHHPVALSRDPATRFYCCQR